MKKLQKNRVKNTNFLGKNRPKTVNYGAIFQKKIPRGTEGNFFKTQSGTLNN